MSWCIDQVDYGVPIPAIGKPCGDGQTPGLLLRQPVSVDTRQRTHECGLAMIDMPDHDDRTRRHRDRNPRKASTTAVISRSVRVRASIRNRSFRIMPITGGRALRKAAASASGV